MATVSIISSAVVAVAAIIGLVWSYFRELGDIKQRLTTLETKTEPFWKFVNESIPEMLIRGRGNPEPYTRRDELLLRYRDGTILPHERDELLRLLEAEREEVKKKNDIAMLILLGLLIAALIAASASK
ncbi:MAG: hypothetical protein ABSB38_07810 [Dehalococcoidia bacterium]